MKIVVHFSGPSCAGKSATEEALGARIPGAYTVSYDKLKWQLAGYHRDKDRELVKDLLIGFFEVVCKQRLPVFLQCFMRDAEEYEAYAAVARAHGYAMRSVELTAPREVLLERFRARVANAPPNAKISVRDESTYLKNLEWKQYVPDGTPVYDTTEQSAEAIADAILAHLTT